MGKTIEYVYGLHTVRHALVNSPERVLTVWVQDNKKNNPDAAEILRLSGRFGIHHE
jgi:tRNA G18 (ribose-2'-O)-methylase SpoU